MLPLSLALGPMLETLCPSRFSDPARVIDPGRGEGQRVRGSTGSNRGSTERIDPVYIQNKKYFFSYIENLIFIEH